MNHTASSKNPEKETLEIEYLKKKIETLEKTVHILNHTLSTVLRRYIA